VNRFVFEVELQTDYSVQTTDARPTARGLRIPRYYQTKMEERDGNRPENEGTGADGDSHPGL